MIRQNTIIDSNFIKKEISCGINIFPVLKYIEDLFGYKRMKSIVEPLGLTVNYLLKKNNWVSYDYYCALLDKLIQTTGDKEVCYKIFMNNTKRNFFGGYFIIYPLNYFKSNNIGIKFKYLLLIQKKIDKISKINVLDSGSFFLNIKITFNPNIKINENFIKAFQGFLASLTIEYGLPPANVRIINDATDENSIIYNINWGKKRNYFLTALPILVITGIEFVVYYFLKFIFNIRDLIFIVVISGLIYIIFEFINNLNKKKQVEKSDITKNFLIIDAINHIEEDYIDQNNHINDLIENNKYLTIINKIRKFNNSLYLNTALFEISKILLKYLSFTKTLYFQYDFKADKFNSIFELDNTEIYDFTNNNINMIINKLNINLEQFNELNKINFFNTGKNIIKILNIKFADLKVINNVKPYKYIYLLPISINNLYYGFFVFFSENSDVSYNKMINNIFTGIKEQVNILFEMISSRKIVENILSSIPSYVLIFDINTFEIKYANNIFFSSFPGLNKNFIKEEIIGKNIFSVIDMSDVEKNTLIESVANLINKDKVDRSVIKAGSKMIEYNLFLTSQNQSLSDNTAGIIMNDITEAKYFQDHLLLNEKLIALGTVACGIAHEINNPLFGILANAEEIASFENIDKNITVYANEIVDLVMNITNIVKDLSTYSKTVRAEEMTEVDINNVIEDSIKLINYSSTIDDVEFKKDFSELKPVNAKKGELEQIFINLFNNAIFAMNGIGTISIKTEYKKDEISISVSDTGSGIKDEDKEYIFDLFYTTKKPDEGTGLGLHIIKKIIEKYNGKISFTSTVGQGTTFTIKFFLS